MKEIWNFLKDAWASNPRWFKIVTIVWIFIAVPIIVYSIYYCGLWILLAGNSGPYLAFTGMCNGVE